LQKCHKRSSKAAGKIIRSARLRAATGIADCQSKGEEVAAITVVWLDWAMMTLSSTESANPDFYQPERNHLGPARLPLAAKDAKTSVTALL
jgi:hypothetical protein